ncbi:MAG: DNA polymerase III subunit [Treponema sp.]|nr:DNA polymerase III subunit [Treponema sp.]
MFENIIDQGAVLQISDDINNNRIAPSMLFYGPRDSAKGSSALELSRVLSCNKDASWKCSCASCGQHRYLQNDDLLVMGNRSFSAEISACHNAFLQNHSSQGAKLIFLRSLRKLILRFSPVLMEDDPKLSKISGVLQSLDERLSEFSSSEQAEKAALEKTCASLVKDALTLENDGLSGNIPVGQIRKASYWCRLAPNGKRKMLIIENADNMKEEGRNSLLKLLEEPPSSVSIVLTSQRREAIMPTILSRLRPYRFLKRSAESEKEVLRRVFQINEIDENINKNGLIISAFLDSFLPQKGEKLESLAAWFLVSLARIVSVSARRNGGKMPAVLQTLGERYAPIADAAGFERSLNGADVIKTILSQSGNFENDSFQRFIKICLDLVCDVTRTEENPQYIEYYEIIKKYTNEAVTSADVLNINTTIVLESLFYKLKTAVSKVMPSGRLYG